MKACGTTLLTVSLDLNQVHNIVSAVLFGVFVPFICVALPVPDFLGLRKPLHAYVLVRTAKRGTNQPGT